MKKIVLLSVCAISFPAHTSFGAVPSMKEGNWELVTTIKSKDMPFPIPPMKLTHCYTQKELKDGQNPAADSDRENGCSVADQKVNGSRTTWSVTCKDGSKGSGQAFYDGNSFDSETMFKDRSGSVTTTSVKGRRLGDCK